MVAASCRQRGLCLIAVGNRIATVGGLASLPSRHIVGTLDDRRPKAFHKVVEERPDGHALATPTRGATCPHGCDPALADSLSGASAGWDGGNHRPSPEDLRNEMGPGPGPGKTFKRPGQATPLLSHRVQRIGRDTRPEPSSAADARVECAPVGDREGSGEIGVSAPANDAGRKACALGEELRRHCWRGHIRSKRGSACLVASSQ
jgi:hypothetical protein